jgi:exopolyphosphatase / guanosine-5'-triphosphate,3'-diphosphate pyrophosphatase
MKLAAIDIGSNSIHMIIALAAGRSFEVIDKEKEMVKLGAGVFRSRRLGERAQRDGLDVMRRYCKLADNIGCDEIIAVATSAVREAENGGEFLDAVRRETGISPRLISGTDEARLIYLGVRHAIALGEDNALIIDIGGGSVELMCGDARELAFSESVRLGVQRLLDGLNGRAGPMTPKMREEIEGHVRFVGGRVLRGARDAGFGRVIGTSGTIRALGEAAHLASGGSSWRTSNAETVSLKQLRKLTGRLVEMEVDERTSIDGVEERRADTVHLGGLLLVQLLEMAGVDEITLCDASLRDGVILDHLERTAPGARAPELDLDVRGRSVLQLARKYSRAGERERHVADLALQIFDQTGKSHGLGAAEREMLEAAALLHSIGQYISFKRHHKHSRYIIKHSGLRGYTDEEVELIGHVARYHRKAVPKKKHGRFRRLPARHKEIVRVLSAILRIAVNLDRSHSQVVDEVQARVKKKKVALRVVGADDLELELWAARRKLEPLGQVLDRKVTVEQA